MECVDCPELHKMDDDHWFCDYERHECPYDPSNDKSAFRAHRIEEEGDFASEEETYTCPHCGTPYSSYSEIGCPACFYGVGDIV